MPESRHGSGPDSGPGSRPIAIPALVIIASTVIAITLIATAVRLTRPLHLDDDLDQRVVDATAYDAIDTRLDVNHATAAELSLLPGVGPRLAQRIVEHRAAHGLFRSIDDLTRVPGIGQRIMERLCTYAVAEPLEPDAGHSMARVSGGVSGGVGGGVSGRSGG
jgi:competence ComEA-like helix-hairpin-helix protein